MTKTEFYFDEKQRKRRQRILKIRIYSNAVVFSLLAAGFFYFLTNSPFLKIKSISAISGEGGEFGAESEELIRDLRIFFASNSEIAALFGPDNILIWRIDIPNFLKNQPAFSNLEISKNYFKREINVKFEKREKFGAWCQQTLTNADYAQTNAEIEKNQFESVLSLYKSACWWFDRNGIIFEKAIKAEGEMIYKIQDNSERRLNPGESIFEKRLFENLLKIFEILQMANLNIKTLYIDNLALEEAEVRPLINSIPQIYFSLRFDPTFALTAIESLKKTGLEKVQYIDFRVENRVYYKLK